MINSRVRAPPHGGVLLLEPYVRVSPHTARADNNPFLLGDLHTVSLRNPLLHTSDLFPRLLPVYGVPFAGGGRQHPLASRLSAQLKYQLPTSYMILLRLSTGGTSASFRIGAYAPVRPVTGRRSLLATSFARCPFPPPCGVGTLAGGQRGCRVQQVGYCVGVRRRL